MIGYNHHHTVCPTGRYLSPSTKSCSACPNNSVSNSPGLTQCTCTDGYYRAMTGEEDLPCTCKFITKY